MTGDSQDTRPCHFCENDAVDYFEYEETQVCVCPECLWEIIFESDDPPEKGWAGSL